MVPVKHYNVPGNVNKDSQTFSHKFKTFHFHNMEIQAQTQSSTKYRLIPGRYSSHQISALFLHTCNHEYWLAYNDLAEAGGKLNTLPEDVIRQNWETPEKGRYFVICDEGISEKVVRLLDEAALTDMDLFISSLPHNQN